MAEFTACVVLPAAGSGTRMGSTPPKQFCMLAGRPLIYYTIKSFASASFVKQIIVTVLPEWRDFMLELITKYDLTNVSVAEGGSERHRSIYNGVKHIASIMSEVPDVVLIHDAVRPFTSEKLMKEVADAARNSGAAGAIKPLVSTVVSTTDEGILDESLDRSKYRNSEMPQAFQYDIIKTAYEKCTDHDMEHGTECLHLAKKYTGATVRLIDTSEDLWKVTTKKDFYAADGILKEKENKVAVAGCKDETKQAILTTDMNRISLVTNYVDSMKCRDTLNAHHIVVFLNEEKHSNGSSEMGDDSKAEETESDVFPDINSCHSLRTLTYVLWNNADGGSGEQEFDDFKSLIKAHHVLGKSHNICTYGLYVEESLLVEEKEFQSNVFSLLADVIFNRNSKLSGQVFEM